MVEDEDYISHFYRELQKYESLLGKLIIAHNGIDYYMSEIISQVCHDNDHNRGMNFSQRITFLEALSKTGKFNDFLSLPFDELKNLNAQRNNYAHGYLPDEDIQLISAKKTIPTASVEDLRKNLELAVRLKDTMFSVSVALDFDDM